MTENVANALCYVLGFITGIIFLVLEPYSKNRNVRFHAFQSIFYSVGVFLVNIILSFVLFSLAFGIGMFGVISLLYRLIQLGFFLFWLFLIYKAYSNERFVIPVIGPIAEKQANS